MAEQNPPGSRPGRPFVAPFRRPAGGEAPGSPAQPGAAPGPSAPRPFVPPGARPAGASSPPQPRPAVPAAPRRAAATPPAPLAPPSPAGEDLTVEHAISETLGQGASPSEGLGLELERASVPDPEGLPSSGDVFAAPPPELTFLSAIEETPPAVPRGSNAPPSSPTLGVVEDALRGAAARGGEAESSGEAASGEDPLSWLAAPAEAKSPPEPRVEHEITTPTFLIAGGYDLAEMRRPITDEPPRRTQPAPEPDEPSTIVGANVSVAEALESIARRVRDGELRVPAIDASTGEAGALAAVLAVLLGVRS
jgi:hypothetical protein